MKRGQVFYKKLKAGVIEQADGVYTFTYDNDYLESENPRPISLTFPLQKKSFEEKTMFSFFDGLIPEGWLLDIVEKNWKLNPKDRMGLLLNMCNDTIGAVTVKDVSEV